MAAPPPGYARSYSFEEDEIACEECGEYIIRGIAEDNDGICYDCSAMIRVSHLRDRLPRCMEIRKVLGDHSKPCQDCGTTDWCYGVDWYVIDASQRFGTGDKYCMDCAETRYGPSEDECYECGVRLDKEAAEDNGGICDKCSFVLRIRDLRSRLPPCMEIRKEFHETTYTDCRECGKSDWRIGEDWHVTNTSYPWCMGYKYCLECAENKHWGYRSDSYSDYDDDYAEYDTDDDNGDDDEDEDDDNGHGGDNDNEVENGTDNSNSTLENQATKQEDDRDPRQNGATEEASQGAKRSTEGTGGSRYEPPTTKRKT